MVRRTVCIALLAVIPLAVFAGGQAEETGGTDEVITVEVWNHSGKGAEREALDASIAAFNEMQDRIQVNLTRLPEGSYNEQVSAAALSGDLPDLLDFDGPFLYNYTWAGHLIPLDDYVSADLRDDFLPWEIRLVAD